jgi:transcriptional regulator with XRE-family HTH domain
MASKETRLQRGRRRGQESLSRSLKELVEARRTLGLSQRAVAAQQGISQAQLWRIETGRDSSVSFVRLCEIASLLGYDVSLGLHPNSDPIRDAGQQALGKRFDALLSKAWSVADEVLLPNPGDKRAWDKVLRLTGAEPRHVVGADLESRIYDIQALVRRTRERERDGGVDEILIVLSDSAHNRRTAPDLAAALGAAYSTQGADIRRALRRGTQLPGSGVILV